LIKVDSCDNEVNQFIRVIRPDKVAIDVSMPLSKIPASAHELQQSTKIWAQRKKTDKLEHEQFIDMAEILEHALYSTLLYLFVNLTVLYNCEW